MGQAPDASPEHPRLALGYERSTVAHGTRNSAYLGPNPSSAPRCPPLISGYAGT